MCVCSECASRERVCACECACAWRRVCGASATGSRPAGVPGQRRLAREAVGPSGSEAPGRQVRRAERGEPRAPEEELTVSA